MVSPKIRGRRATDTAQLTLSFEPGLADRYRSLRECIAAGVYQRGLSSVAIDLDKAPGNLSVELSDDPTRKFGVDSFEEYLAKAKDPTPIYYLIEKFLQPADRNPSQEAALSQLPAVMAQLQQLMQAAGVQP